CSQRSLVDHAVPLFLGQLLLFTPGAGKDVVDVDGVVEVGVEINGRAAGEITAAVLHEQGGQPFVGRSEAALQGEQPYRGEVSIADRTRFAAAFDPGDHILDVHADAGFIGTAVQFAEHTTPVPAQQLLFDAVLRRAVC